TRKVAATEATTVARKVILFIRLNSFRFDDKTARLVLCIHGKLGSFYRRLALCQRFCDGQPHFLHGQPVHFVGEPVFLILVNGWDERTPSAVPGRMAFSGSDL